MYFIQHNIPEILFLQHAINIKLWMKYFVLAKQRFNVLRKPYHFCGIFAKYIHTCVCTYIHVCMCIYPESHYEETLDKFIFRDNLDNN
jgi:hypothetical protein